MSRQGFEKNKRDRGKSLTSSGSASFIRENTFDAQALGSRRQLYSVYLSFRACLHLRSLAPVSNYFLMIMMANGIPTFVLRLRKTPGKNLNQEN